MATRININGVTIVSHAGGSVVINNGRVVVDGKDVTPEAKQITIEIHGDLQTLQADACERIDVSGSVGEVTTMSGDVRCGDVAGSVRTMSGDVSCARIGGSASSMSGDIRHG